jgi:hypothetical protein
LAHGAEGILMRDLADVLWPEQEADIALRKLGVALTKILSVNKDVHYPSVRDGRGTEEANGEGKA